MTNPSFNSVCMATYNGEAYITEQVGSVLSQLHPRDELIIIDDGSRDRTVLEIESIGDRRLRIIRHGQNLGVRSTFEHALQEASGDIIFLCDQDDIWSPKKIEKVLKVFDADPSVTLVLTNGELMDASGQPLGSMHHQNRRVPLGLISNLVKNRYQGSAMAFRREILDAVLPFPKSIPMHDAWIGLVNSIVGRAVYLPEELMFYRQHENSVTKRTHGPLLQMLRQRAMLMAGILFRLKTLIQTRSRLRRHLPRLICAADIS